MHNEALVNVKHPWRSLTILLASCFIALLNETMMSVTLTTLASEFNLSANTVQWLTSGYILTTAITIPVSAFLIHTFTTKQMFSISMGFLLGGSLIASFAPSFAILMISRVIQAIGAGMFVSIAISTGLAILPPSKHGFINALTICAATLGPALGPIYAGAVLNFAEWQTLFRILDIPEIILFVFGLIYIENASDMTKPHLDILSVVLSSCGFFSLIYAISVFMTDVLLGIIILAASIGILTIWWRRQLKLTVPVLNMRIMRTKGFIAGILIMILLFLAQMGVNVVIPMVYQSGHGFTTLKSALLLLPSALALSISTPVGGILFDKFGGKKLIITGILIQLIAVFALAALGIQNIVPYIVLFCIILFCANGLSTSPLQSAMYARVKPEERTDAISIVQTSMQIGSSLGTTFTVGMYSFYAIGYTGTAVPEFFAFSRTFLLIGFSFIFVFFLSLYFFKAKTTTKDTKRKTSRSTVQNL